MSGMFIVPPEPTADQCSNREKVIDQGFMVGYAMWYPQMGGYSGKCVAIFYKDTPRDKDGELEDTCFDVYVWHDGSFPFSDGQSPAHLHHCNPDQFVEFGVELSRMLEKHATKGVDG